jgi:FtsP/CotA-like multicopper oxidase with cupredoxin domain
MKRPAGTVAPAGGVVELGASAFPSIGREATLDLRIDFTDAQIYNPGTRQYDKVRLRSYRDAHEEAPPTVPFVAPTIEVMPGETVRITLLNKLPTEPNCEQSPVNQPHCFNTTNLHAHGVWVSPSGNSDNVLLAIKPNVAFQYEYNVPSDHPAGTFWYHPHRHGSTALQVASGMAGVLIVRGLRPPDQQTTGDVDTLLKHPDGTPFRDRIVLIQQIQYACRDQAGEIKVERNQQNQIVAWRCDAGDIGEIAKYDQFGPPTWRQSGRYTSINGEVIPTFADAQAGRIERWRIVHAGVRDTVKLQFRKMRPGATYTPLAAADTEDWVAQNCLGEPLSQFAVASDGLTRAQIIHRAVTVLQPGYREDLLMLFPEEGNYCIIDDQAPASTTVNVQGKSRKFLGSVAVTGGAAVADTRQFVQEQLISAADRFMPVSVRQKVRDDLGQELKLTSFVPHLEIGDGEVKGRQSLTFKIDAGGLQIDNKPYDPNRIDRTLLLGSVDEWTLTSQVANHPFHIHVNPFQVVRILNGAGQDVSVAGEGNDPQYANLKGAWKDTLLVKQGYQVILRTRYQRYIGDFVLHCHILDHEDQGMMQNVRIGIPDGSGGVALSHH